MVTSSAYWPVWALVLRRTVYLLFPCPWRCQQSGTPSLLASVSSEAFLMEIEAAAAVGMCPRGSNTLKRRQDHHTGEADECRSARMWGMHGRASCRLRRDTAPSAEATKERMRSKTRAERIRAIEIGAKDAVCE